MKLIVNLALLTSLTACAAGAQTYDPLPGPWPYGPDDEAGASNTQTAEQVLEAVKLVKTGKVYRLGHVYEADMPVFPGDDGWHMTPRPVQMIGGQRINTEKFEGEIVQLGTEFDALGHFGILPPEGPIPATSSTTTSSRAPR